MKMVESDKSKKVLDDAEVHFNFVADKLKSGTCTDQEKFKLLWSLGFIKLRDLEEFRIPDPLTPRNPSERMTL